MYPIGDMYHIRLVNREGGMTRLALVTSTHKTATTYYYAAQIKVIMKLIRSL